MLYNEMHSSVCVTQEDTGWFVATDIVTGVSSQGETPELAMANIAEALELYYESIPSDLE